MIENPVRLPSWDAFSEGPIWQYHTTREAPTIGIVTTINSYRKDHFNFFGTGT